MINKPKSEEAGCLVGIVGPCAAGKSTLVISLKQHGIRAKHIAQEHSYVPDMWHRLTNPDILVYLDVAYPITLQRRNMNWNIKEYDEQIKRLKHARQHADIHISTDDLTPQDILDKVLALLNDLHCHPLESHPKQRE